MLGRILLGLFVFMRILAAFASQSADGGFMAYVDVCVCVCVCACVCARARVTFYITSFIIFRFYESIFRLLFRPT